MNSLLSELRKNCNMRHKNGNCMPCGGFCTAVNDPICSAVHNAYDTGFRNGISMRKHGLWMSYFNNKVLMCSVCRTTFWNEQEKRGSPYCPNCGAEMDGEADG